MRQSRLAMVELGARAREDEIIAIAQAFGISVDALCEAPTSPLLLVQ